MIVPHFLKKFLKRDIQKFYHKYYEKTIEEDAFPAYNLKAELLFRYHLAVDNSLNKQMNFKKKIGERYETCTYYRIYLRGCDYQY